MKTITTKRQLDFIENLEEEHKMTIAELEGWYNEAKKLKLVR